MTKNDSPRGLTSDKLWIDEFALFESKKMSLWKRIKWKWFIWKLARIGKKASKAAKKIKMPEKYEVCKNLYSVECFIEENDCNSCLRFKE